MTHTQPAAPTAAADAYDGPADSLGSWQHAVAARRMQVIIADAFESFMAAAKAKPGLTVSQHVAGEIVRLHPGVLDVIGGVR
jgi:hypothetical protein